MKDQRVLTQSAFTDERMEHVRPISAIINNPNAGIMQSFFNILNETFSDISYTPNMTEDSVIPSPLLPEIDPSSFFSYCQSLSKVNYFKP